MRRAAWLAIPVAALLVAAVAAKLTERTPLPPPASVGLDADGDPLPPFALVRVGSARFHGAATGLAFARDGRAIVHCTTDGFVRTVDRASGAPLFEFPAQTGWVERPPDESLWDSIRRRVELSDERVRDWIGECAFSQDGARVVTRGPFWTNVYETATGRRLAKWRALDDVLHAWTPDGSRVVGAAWNADVVVRDAASGAVVVSSKSPGAAPSGGWSGRNCVVVSPDGRFAAAQTWRLRVVDLATGAEVFAPPPAGLASTSASDRFAGPVAFSADGAFFVRRRDSTRCLVHETKTWKVVREIALPAEPIGFAPDLATALVGAPRRRLVALADGATLREFDDDGFFSSEVVFSADGATLAALKGDAVRLFDVATGAALRPPAELAFALAWSPDGRRLAVSDSVAIRVVDAATGRTERTIAAPPAKLRLHGFTDDGSRIAAISRAPSERASSLVLYGADDGVERSRTALPRDGLAWPLVRADGEAPRCLVNEGEKILVLETATGRVEAERASDGVVDFVEESNSWVVETDDAFEIRRAATDELVARGARPWRHGSRLVETDHGRLLVSDDSARVVVVDERTGRRIAFVDSKAPLRGCAAISRDGRILASFDAENAVRLFDAADGEELATLVGHRGAARALAFSPDGRRLATAAEDGSVFVWDVEAAAKR